MGLSIQEQEKIKSALERLVKKDYLDAFVIIEEKTSDKFVQFAVNNHQLVFDLPSKQLSSDEFAEMERVLEKFDISFELENMYDSSDADKVVGEIGLFNKEIGDDVDVAMDIVNNVIDVFNPSRECKISIEEN